MALQNAEIYTYFNTYDYLINNLLSGQRGFANDTFELLWKDEGSDFYAVPFNKKVVAGVPEFLDVTFKEVTVDIVNTNELKSADMTTTLKVSEEECTSLSPDFTKISIIGCLNELMDYIQGGSISNYWEKDDGLKQIKPIPALGIEIIYSEKYFSNQYTAHPIWLADAVDTYFSVDFTSDSIIGALNELKNETLTIGYPNKLYWRADPGDPWLVRLTANEDSLTSEFGINIIPMSEVDDNYVYLYMEHFNLVTDKSSMKILSIVPSEVVEGLEFQIGIADDPFDSVDIYADYIGLSGIDIAPTLITMNKTVDFDHSDYFWKAADWKFKDLGGDAQFYLYYDVPDGTGIALTFGTSFYEEHPEHFLETIQFSAKQVFINDGTVFYNLFEVVDFTVYPSALYYNNDWEEIRIEAGDTSSTVYGRLNLDGYDDSTYLQYLQFANSWMIRSDSAGDTMDFCAPNAQVDTWILNIGTNPDCDESDHVLDEINLWASHIFVKKLIGSTKYDLLEFVQGGLYPDKLYWTGDTGQPRLYGVATCTQVHGMLDYTDNYLEASGTRYVLLKSDYWQISQSRNSGTGALTGRFNIEFMTTTTTESIVIGTNDAITAQADFVHEIHLRARHVYVADGVLNIDLLTLTSGSGLSKATRVTMSGSQSLNTTTESIVQFNSEVYDDDARHSTSTYKFTAQETKIHSVDACIRFTGGAAGTCILRIYKNTTLMAFSSHRLTLAGDFYVHVSGVFKVTTSDTIEIRAYQDTGYSGTIQATGWVNYVC